MAKYRETVVVIELETEAEAEFFGSLLELVPIYRVAEEVMGESATRQLYDSLPLNGKMLERIRMSLREFYGPIDPSLRQEKADAKVDVESDSGGDGSSPGAGAE